MNEIVRIGSRGSELALWQAHWVRSRMRALHPGLTIVVQIIKTKGDKVLDAPLSKIGDKGLFTREKASLGLFLNLAVAFAPAAVTGLPRPVLLRPSRSGRPVLPEARR